MATQKTPGSQGAERLLAQRLERGEVLYYPRCPFPMPEGDDLQFLYGQELGGRVHKNISYDPCTGKVGGCSRRSSVQVERLGSILRAFADSATHWLSANLPRYAASWQLDRVSYRPAEEATRQLRQSARNDLLHVDAFPTRPTNGARILRLFVNVNPTEPRIWITSHPFAELLARYGKEVGLPRGDSIGWLQWLRDAVVGLFRPGQNRRSGYDTFMLRFHHFLKANKEFQADSPRRWEFAPGSAWMVMTDTASHAVLSGRYALEHSYFVAPESQFLPEESPAALLRRASGVEVLARAA